MHKSSLIIGAAATLVMTATPSQALTIIVNIDNTAGVGNGAAPSTQTNAAVATAANFQTADANVNGSAVVNLALGDGNNSTAAYTNLNTLDAVGDDAAIYPIDAAGDITGTWNAGAGYTNTDPILETYVFDNGTTANRVTINGLGSVPAGLSGTLTVYGVGDGTGQNSNVAPSYGGFVFTPATLLSTYGTTATSFVKFNFTTIAATSSLAFDWGGNGAPGRLNGFSLTIVPEPSTTAVFGLAALGMLVRRRRA